MQSLLQSENLSRLEATQLSSELAQQPRGLFMQEVANTQYTKRDRLSGETGSLMNRFHFHFMLPFCHIQWQSAISTFSAPPSRQTKQMRHRSLIRIEYGRFHHSKITCIR